MKKYCETCGKLVDTKIENKREYYEISGEKIGVNAKVLVCEECGEEFFCEELDNGTLVEAYNIYREKHKLLFPNEIKMIREQYHLSQRSFAKLLNWGDKTVHRYENGALQDKAHNSLLLFLRKPENMKSYLMENEVLLDERQKEKIFSRIEELESAGGIAGDKPIFNYLFSKEASINNGYKVFDYEKFCAMVLYFAHKCDGLLKVKLFKLLNYSDMIFYKENGVSISGTQYIHLPYGPVPQNYDILLGLMEADRIMHIQIEYENGFERHRVIPDQKVKNVVLSDDEISVLNWVYQKFADYSSSEISEYSHNERGYKNTKQGDVISYAYAKDIQLDSYL